MVAVNLDLFTRRYCLARDYYGINAEVKLLLLFPSINAEVKRLLLIVYKI